MRASLRAAGARAGHSETLAEVPGGTATIPPSNPATDARTLGERTAIPADPATGPGTGPSKVTASRALWPIATIVVGALGLVLVATLALGLAFYSWSRPTPEAPLVTEKNPSTPAPAGPALKTFRFDTVTVDARGQVVARGTGEARYFVEDLGGANLEMVVVPAGTFAMGTPEIVVEPIMREARRGDARTAAIVATFLSWQVPQHTVTAPSYYLGKYEVTQAQWRAVAALPKVRIDLPPDPSQFKGDDLPVERVSWEEAVEFCERLSRKTGRRYRLPAEAEWEYAYRGGTSNGFYCGDSITPEVANFDGTKPWIGTPRGLNRGRTTAVGSMGVANPFGLYDMAGNVFEFCQDPFHANYVGAPADGSVWSVGGEPGTCILRGGSWQLDAGFCAGSFRGKDVTTARWPGNGFRVAADLAR
jgi:formylglycine-generating enzyme required for sulfatase activity